MPESAFALTCPSAAIMGAPPIAKPTRQPVMLKVLERLWNSIATVLGPGDLEDAGRRLVEVHLVVGGILGDHEVVGPGQLDDLSRRRRGRPCRRSGLFGIVEEHQPRQRIDVGGDRVEVGAEAEAGSSGML